MSCSSQILGFQVSDLDFPLDVTADYQIVSPQILSQDQPSLWQPFWALDVWLRHRMQEGGRMVITAIIESYVDTSHGVHKPEQT